MEQTLMQTPSPPESAFIQSTTATIMVVEAGDGLRASIAAFLAGEGYRVESAATASEAIRRLPEASPAMVIVSSRLPDMGTGETCRRLRMASSAHMLLLLGDGQETERLIGLAVGADDHLTKPFDGDALLGKVHKGLQQPGGDRPPIDNPQVCSRLTIDRLAREVCFDDEEVHLTRTEFDLLANLAARPDLVLSRRVLLDRVWGEDWVGDTHIVDVHIGNLRRKIDQDGFRHIRTIRGVGYRFVG